MFLHFFLKKNSCEQKLYKQLKAILGFRPRNMSYYKMALRHSSANKIEGNRKKYNNERLEFLGDSIISVVSSILLYEKYPKANEGDLSVLRSTLVSRKSLNRIASELKLKDIMEYKESKNNEVKNIIGNSLEALVGAVYFDRGYKKSEKFVKELFVKYFDLDNLMKQNTDYKSKLLQASQKEKFNLLIDSFENMEGKDRQYHFVTEICINNKFISTGKGWAKKDAEQKASYEALKIIGRSI